MDRGRMWRWGKIGGCAAAVTALAGGMVVWQASRALRLSKQELRAEQQINFVVRSIDPPQHVSFEPVHSPEEFNQLAYFQNRLYVAGPAGLSEYDLSGTLLREFPVGAYLPGSPLVGMAVGRVAGAANPALILATADQGILVFDGQKFQQIYPADAEVRAVTAILPVSSGSLLIGTKKRGVLAYDGKTIHELHPTLSHLHVQALAGSEVDLWVGTLDQGVKHWHAGATESFSEDQGLPDKQVQGIALSGEKAYVGTPAGVAEFDQGRILARVSERNPGNCLGRSGR